MNLRVNHLTMFFCLILMSLSSMATPTSAESIQQKANQDIAAIYQALNKHAPATMAERILFVSHALLEKPYLLGALGEGPEGEYDQSPLYRTDAFDCETYVDVTLAIALAKDSNAFKHCIRKIRYKNGHVTFTDRNHFLSLDWNQNNQRQQFIEDITHTIKNQHNESVTKTAKALINKPGWYEHLKIDQIKLDQADEQKRKEKLDTLKNAGRQLKQSTSIIDYIPLSALFDKDGEPNHFIFQQIPNASIIEIIRPNWDLRKAVGTCLNASHLGFAIWKDNTLYFREASSIHHKTIDVPLIDYLRSALKSPTIGGIHIEAVLPQTPLPGTCRL